MLIQYLVHSTTRDNETGVATGWENPSLSPLGVRQAEELRSHVSQLAGAIFTSDLTRAIQTAQILFPGRESTSDRRLREMNYGDFNGSPSQTLPALRIDERFPGGESLRDVQRRILSLLDDLSHRNLSQVILIGHRAPQLALEILCGGKSWKQAIEGDWRLSGAFQPFWRYHYEGQSIDP